MSDDGFQRLFRETYPSLLVASERLCKDRSLAQDVVQGVFMRFYESGRITEVDSPPAYLRRAVVSRTINAIRDRKRFDLPGEEALWSAAEQSPATEPAHLADLEERLHQAITKLPPRAQLILQMSRFEGLSHKEIAEQLEIAPKTVENQVARAIKLLRKFMPASGLIALLIKSAPL